MDKNTPKIKEPDKLNGYQIRFIIRLLAYYDTYADTAENFEYTYGTAISVELVSRMDPMNQDCCLTEEQIDFFHDKRRKMHEAAVVVPVCDKLWRIMKYQELLEYFQKSGDFKMVTKVLENMDNETGPVYEELVKLLKFEKEVGNQAGKE